MASDVNQKPLFLPDIKGRNRVKPSIVMRKQKESLSLEKKQDFKMTVEEIAEYRNSLHKNLCVSMLREGFHRSFAEFFALLQYWNTARSEGGPDCELWYQLSLEEQPLKLKMLREWLPRAEAAQRADLHKEVYESYLTLAKFFSEPEDRWLCHHFYELGLVAARKVKSDSGKTESEACALIGQFYLEQGDLTLAQEHFEAFHQLALGQSWQDESGQTHQSAAFQGLGRIYILQAQKHIQNKEYMPAVEILTKTYEMAKEAGNRRIEGEAAYRVALVYQNMGNQNEVKKFLDRCVEIFIDQKDTESLGNTYKAMAKYQEIEGNLSESLQYLQNYAEVSQENKHDHNLQDACMCLGNMNFSRGQYKCAFDHFSRAFEISCTLDSVLLLQKAQLHTGIAQAHAMLPTFMSNVGTGCPDCVRKLINWKERREDV